MMMMEEKKMKPKWRFIFQINEHGSGTQLHEEKGQNKDLTALTTHTTLHPHTLAFNLLSFQFPPTHSLLAFIMTHTRLNAHM